jgi:hypothetical protein
MKKIVWTVCEATEKLELAEQVGGSSGPGGLGAITGAKKRRTPATNLGAAAATFRGELCLIREERVMSVL